MHRARLRGMRGCVLLAFLAVALQAVAVLAQGDATCGKEGQKPCDFGCVHPYTSLEETRKYGDNYVPAPRNYKFAPEGFCTRCGNFYEPACKGGICFGDMYSDEVLQLSRDGYCIPMEEQYGCGMHGKAPCPADIVDELGTLAVVTRPADGITWRIAASVYVQGDGCLFSDFNPQLRFVRAPPDELPGGHECAQVCMHCGHANEPACPVKPFCARRRSFEDPSLYIDSPVMQVGDQCRQTNCGTLTASGPLAPCAPGVLGPLDVNGDGCAEPYLLGPDRLCSVRPDNARMSPLEVVEAHCAAEGRIELTRDMLPRFQELNPEATARLGECVPCGRDMQLPCPGVDYGGCYVNEGFIEDEGVCRQAQCGGLGSNFLANPPYGDELCRYEIPASAARDDFLNPRTNCLAFHNLEDDDLVGRRMCAKCGWPGNPCEQECVYTIEWAPQEGPTESVGTYSFRPDLRNPDHCAPLEPRELYPDNCADPFLSGAEAAAAVRNGPSAAVLSDPLDPTFGTASNVDTCQRPVPINQIYTDVCPGGGEPVIKHGQCGGSGYKGARCCYGYSVCVQKNEGYSECDDANVPAGVVPWHAACDPQGQDFNFDSSPGVCELGSSCRQLGGAWFCVPEARHLVRASAAGGSGGMSAGATAAVVIAVFALLIVASVTSFLAGRRYKKQYGYHRWTGDKGGTKEEAAAAAEGKHSRVIAGTAGLSSDGGTYMQAASEGGMLGRQDSLSDGALTPPPPRSYSSHYNAFYNRD